MRDRDRFWWISGLMTLGLFFAGILAPWWFPWLIQQQLPASGPDSEPGPDPITLIFAAVIGLMCLGGSALFLIMAARMRGRHARRLAALRGDFTGMPQSVIHPYPAHAPDVSMQPLEIMWRISPVMAIFHGLSLGLALLGALITPGVFVAFVLLSHFAPSLAPSLFGPPTSTQPLSAAEMAWTAVYAVLFVAIVASGIWIVVRVGPMLFLGRPFGLRVTTDGIESRNELGVRTYLAWNEIRLFEVAGPQAQFSRSFSVYGPGKSISWREYRTGLAAEYLPAGATAIENTQRLAALVNLVTARTGLEPRTIVRALERPSTTAPTAALAAYPPTPPMPYPPYPQPASPLTPYPPTPESYAVGPESFPSVAGRAQPVPAVRLELPAEARQRARNRRSNAAIWVVFALCLVALACAEGVVPVTDYAWVNWASVAALALLALNCIRLAAASLRPRKPAVAEAGPPPVAAPTLDDATSAYALSWHAPARNRGRLLVLGLPLAVNLIPGAIAMFQAFGAFFSINPLFSQQPPTDPANAIIGVFGSLWDFILGFMLVFLGLGGIVQLVVALRLTRAPAVTLRVDANGLTRLTTFKPILIPWSTMREVVWTPHGIGSAPAYIVRTDDALQTITWPTSPQYLDSTLTPTNTHPIGPDELAALVAARIGQSIRVSA
jgi:hypothetical protein